jgi:hypothetical protein
MTIALMGVSECLNLYQRKKEKCLKNWPRLTRLWFFQLHSLFVCLLICFWRDSPQWARASSFTRFLDHTQRRTTVGRTPLDEWSARLRDFYPQNTQHFQQTDIHAPGGIRTHNLSRRTVAHLRVRPSGRWDRPNYTVRSQNVTAFEFSLFSWYSAINNQQPNLLHLDCMFLISIKAWNAEHSWTDWYEEASIQ